MKNIKEGRMMLRRLLIGMLFMFSLTMPMLAMAEEQAAQPEATTEAIAAPATAVPQEITDKIASAQIAGDTAWVLASSALLMLMTLGLPFTGHGQEEECPWDHHRACGPWNHHLQWVLIGYSLAFGPDKGGMIGGLEWLGLANVGWSLMQTMQDHPASGVHDIPDDVCHNHPSPYIRGICRRMKFSAYLVFITLWAFLVYDLSVTGMGHQRLDQEYRRTGLCRRNCCSHHFRCHCPRSSPCNG